MLTVIVRTVAHRVTEGHDVSRFVGVWARAIGTHQETADQAAVGDIADRINAWAYEDDGAHCRHYEARVTEAHDKLPAPRPDVRARLEAGDVWKNPPGAPGRINYRGEGK